MKQTKSTNVNASKAKQSSSSPLRRGGGEVKQSLLFHVITFIYIIIAVGIYKIYKLFKKTVLLRFLKRIYNIIAIQFCILEANSLHRLTDQRYYVLKIDGKIRVFSTKQINLLRNKRFFGKNLDYIKLQQISYYKTK